MAKYTGVHCPVCKKRFTDGDDVVVCPICGAPHHRECYRSLGHCALDELHIKGHTWQPDPSAGESVPGRNAADAGASGENTPCPACGAHNPSAGLFCQICGAPLRGPAAQSQSRHPENPYAGGWQRQPAQQSASQQGYAAAFGGLSPDETVGDLPARDLALFVGDNSQYFLPRFKLIAEQGSFSFNFCAFLFSFFYFFYRKMYLIGSILLGLFILTMAPTFFAMPEYAAFLLANIEDITMGIIPPFDPQQHLWAWRILPFMRYAMLGFNFLFAALANRFYLNHAANSIHSIRRRHQDENGSLPDDRTYAAELSLRGRISRGAVIAVFGAVAGGYLTICFLIAAFVQI